jgi:16S rRNA (guanine527-N7)-methyltransferase
VVTARAVAALPVLAELCIPLVKKGGRFIAFKTGSAEEEIKESRRAANILGVGDTTIQDAGVPGTDHIFVVMKKKVKTSEKYPRKAGEPARKPL